MRFFKKKTKEELNELISFWRAMSIEYWNKLNLLSIDSPIDLKGLYLSLMRLETMIKKLKKRE